MRDRQLSGRATVALAGLLPVYQLGLQQGLTAVGLKPVVLADDGELIALVRSGKGPCAVVLPAGQYDALVPVSARSSSALAVIVVLADGAPERYAEALRAGATGVVVVDASLEEVLDVVVAALHGHTLLPTAVARSLAHRAAGTYQIKAQRLRPEEVGWLRGLADSSTVASVARSAGYSEREMYRLLAALYRRMGVGNRTEALLLAQQWGLLVGARSAAAEDVEQ